MVNAPALSAEVFDAVAGSSSGGSDHDKTAVAAIAAEEGQESDNCMGQLHSAGYDALCTGMLAGYFALAEGEGRQGIARSRFASDRSNPKPISAASGESAEDRTRTSVLLRRWKDALGQQLYLTGKDFPLRLVTTQWGG